MSGVHERNDAKGFPWPFSGTQERMMNRGIKFPWQFSGSHEKNDDTGLFGHSQCLAKGYWLRFPWPFSVSRKEW